MLAESTRFPSQYNKWRYVPIERRQASERHGCGSPLEDRRTPGEVTNDLRTFMSFRSAHSHSQSLSLLQQDQSLLLNQDTWELGNGLLTTHGTPRCQIITGGGTVVVAARHPMTKSISLWFLLLFFIRKLLHFFLNDGFDRKWCPWATWVESSLRRSEPLKENCRDARPLTS